MSKWSILGRPNVGPYRDNSLSLMKMIIVVPEITLGVYEARDGPPKQ